MDSVSHYDHTRRGFVFALLVWALAILVAGYYRVFTLIPLIGIPPLVFTGIGTPIWLYYRNERFRSYIQSVSLKHLTLFNIWRIPAGLAFLYYGSHGLLPEQFVHNAAYGDLGVGFLVPVVLTLRGGGSSKYLAFHIFGLLDFIVAVGTGITFTLLQVPLMENIRTFPIVLIPLFGVCITGAFHIMTLDILLRKYLGGSQEPIRSTIPR